MLHPLVSPLGNGVNVLACWVTAAWQSVLSLSSSLCWVSLWLPLTWFTRAITGHLAVLWFLLLPASSSSRGLCRFACTLGSRAAKVHLSHSCSRTRTDVHLEEERQGERKACGRKSGGMGREGTIRPWLGSAACLVSLSVCGVLCFLQAAAEPVAVGSVHSSLHSAWRPPARGLTFPEVLSHSASCYSPWQVELDHSDLRREGEATRFRTSHWSSPAGGAEISRCLQKMGRGVNLAFGPAGHPWCRSGVRSSARSRRWIGGGGSVDGEEGHRNDRSAVSAVRLPKTKLHGGFSWTQQSRVTQVPKAGGKNRRLIHLSFCTECSRNTPWRSPWSSAHSACQLETYWRV